MEDGGKHRKRIGVRIGDKGAMGEAWKVHGRCMGCMGCMGESRKMEIARNGPVW